MKISIITPSFNQAEFIGRTVDSVLAQQGDFDLEYLVVDGGSTDGSQEVLAERIAAAGERERLTCRIISEPDEGQADAINKGLRMATGDLAAYLNSDDVYEPGALARITRYFQEHPEVQLVTGYCRIIDANDREIRRWITRYKNFFLRRASFRRLLVENFISQPATFWRRSLHDEIGFFDKDQFMVMDYDMWCRIASRYGIEVIPEYLASFRWHVSSKSGQHYERQFRDQYRVACRYLAPSSPLRWIHWANLWKIVWAYRIMGWARRIFK